VKDDPDSTRLSSRSSGIDLPVVEHLWGALERGDGGTIDDRSASLHMRHRGPTLSQPTVLVSNEEAYFVIANMASMLLRNVLSTSPN